MSMFNFIVDHQRWKEIEEALEKEKINVKEERSETCFKIFFKTKSEKKVLKLNQILDEIHQLKDNGTLPEDQELMYVSLNQRISIKAFYVDYLLSSVFLQILREGGIPFLVVKDFRVFYLMFLDTIPIKIKRSDLKKVEDLLDGCSLGHPYLRIISKKSLEGEKNEN